MLAVRRLYRRYPVLGNVLVYGTLYTAGDISQQTIAGRTQYDLDSAKRMGTVGATIFGPLGTFWYPFLEKFLPGTSKKVIVKKILADQGIMTPLCVTIFYVATSVLEGKEDIFKEVIEKGPRTALTGCVYWPAVQVINFTLVPTAYRALYAAAAAFVWTNVLSFYKSQITSHL